MTSPVNSDQLLPPEAPVAEHLARLVVEVAEPVDIGMTSGGHRRMVPILGGTVEGRLRGRVLPGGADHQVLRSERTTDLEAKYVIETEGGDRIHVTNIGLRSGSAEDIAAIVRGEPVPAERIYFRSSPRLDASGEEWAWLADRIFVGTGQRLPSAVVIDIWLV